MIMAIPCHLSVLGLEYESAAGLIQAHHARYRLWLPLAGLASLVIGAIGTFVPLRIGIKAFERMEF
jgi:ABC-2 type transport system permease protein